jgi:hypothetical protein
VIGKNVVSLRRPLRPITKLGEAFLYAALANTAMLTISHFTSGSDNFKLIACIVVVLPFYRAGPHLIVRVGVQGLVRFAVPGRRIEHASPASPLAFDARPSDSPPDEGLGEASGERGS